MKHAGASASLSASLHSEAAAARQCMPPPMPAPLAEPPRRGGYLLFFGKHHRQSGGLQDPGLLRCRGRMPAPGNGPKIALKGLYPVYSLTKMFKKEFGRRQDSGILPALWRYFKVLCPALRCSNGSNRGPWNATHQTHQRTDTHVHDSRRHPSICRGAYHGQDRVEDTPP